MQAMFARPKKLINYFAKLYIKPDFPFLADGIAEPCPDMNIKVAAFTVSEKSINTWCNCRSCAAILLLSFNILFLCILTCPKHAIKR